MFAAGAVEEVKSLLRLRLSETAEKIIGIKEIKSYLDGAVDLAAARELMQKNTRNYAKRQMTWFRKDRRIEWIATGGLSCEEAAEKVMAALALKN